jgi:hypothetical protein
MADGWREIVSSPYTDVGVDGKLIWREARFTVVCESGEPVAKLETAGDVAIEASRKLLSNARRKP